MQFDEIRPGVKLAWRADGPPPDGHICGLFWLGGFKSDMTGTKAESLADWAKRSGRSSVRFDYSGHGASGGDFLAGTLSLWLSEALHMFRWHAPGPRIVIGSSMGGWLASLLYRALGAEAERVKGVILIAPAHDMTEALMWKEFSSEARDAILAQGVWHRPSAYGDPYPITLGLIDDGRQHQMLDQAQPIACPVRILQGAADADVPWQHAIKVFNVLDGRDVRMTLVKDGDHRLSRPVDLDLLLHTTRELTEAADLAAPR